MHFFVSASLSMQKLRAQAELLAQADVPVLIVGEPGSGKAALGRLILASCRGAPGAAFSESTARGCRSTRSRIGSSPVLRSTGARFSSAEIAAMRGAFASQAARSYQCP